MSDESQLQQGVFARAIDLIGQIVKNASAEDAWTVVQMVRDVYDKVTANAGLVTAADVHKALDELEQVLHANDAAADAEIRRKFGDPT